MIAAVGTLKRYPENGQNKVLKVMDMSTAVLVKGGRFTRVEAPRVKATKIVLGYSRILDITSMIKVFDENNYCCYPTGRCSLMLTPRMELLPIT